MVRRFGEDAEDYNGVLESWRDTFDMELTDEGCSWKPFWDQHNDLVDRYNALVKRWNKLIPLVNTQDVGRPLAASEAQVTTVTKMHKAGKSLRGIAEDTNLGLRTVRTIVGRINHSDGTTKKRWRRIEIDKMEQAHWKSRKRTGYALVKEAKGLGGRHRRQVGWIAMASRHACSGQLLMIGAVARFEPARKKTLTFEPLAVGCRLILDSCP